MIKNFLFGIFYYLYSIKSIEMKNTKNTKTTLNKRLIGQYNPCRVAMKDISEYLRSQDLQIFDREGDVWVVTPTLMVNKEARKLNAELGLHKVNKGKRAA